MKEKTNDNRSAARALDILELFSEQRRPIFVTEIAKLLKVPLSSCFQLLNTLESCGYAYSLGPRRGYYLTNKILRLASEVAAYDPLPQIFGPVLTKLRDACQETVLLAQMIQYRIVILYVSQSEQRIRFNAQVGELWPVHCSSMGRALMSRMSEKERRDVLDNIELTRFNDTTVTDPEAILKIVDEGKAVGWHMGQGETIPDLCGIAAPVELMGQWFAVSIAGPAYRIAEQLQNHTELLAKACEQLSRIESST